MFRLTTILFALVLGALVTTPAAIAQVVSGSITDADNKVPFGGAIISIEGLNKQTTSDDRGNFRLANVPPGDYTLLVSYVGADDKSIPIKVTSDGLVLGDITIGAASGVLEEVLIIGQAAAIAGALNQERSADNLVSVLDTDAMGQFPDQNVAESLRRLSGVTVENDQGEGRYVVIRGMDPDLNSTSINGVAATSAESRRALQLDVIPSDVLDGLEVHKTLTADMDADSIGGAINVKTLSAFSRKGPYMKARLESQYNELREKWSPKGSIAGSNIFELSNDRRLGVAGAISFNNRHMLANNNEADDWEVADNGADFAEEFQPRLYTIDRERVGGVLNFDLDFSETTSFHLYSLYSKFEDTELRNRTTFKLDGMDEDTVTDASADYAEAEIERDTKDRAQSAEMMSVSFGSETQLTDWLFETNFGYANAKEKTPDQVEATWVAEYESGEDGIAADTPVLALDRSNAQRPDIVSAYWSLLQDASRYELDEIENSREINQDTQYSIKLDASKDMGFGAIKFGVKGRWREKKSDEDVELWSGDDVWFLSDVVQDGAASMYGFSTPMDPVANPRGVRDILNSGVGLEYEDLDSEIDSNVSDFNYKEDIFAAYFMATFDGERATGNVGLRVEQTKTTNSGNIVEFFEEGQEYEGVELEDDMVVITPISSKNSYTDWLPSANLKFEFSEALIGRASVYKSVVRPRVEDVAYRVAIEDNEAELGNPDLKPFRAWNLDASISYYPTDLSVLSAGVFYKKIQDFIFVQTVDDYEWEDRVFDEATTALNGEDAEVVGLELNYQQHFGFLGAPWDAFLIAVNYTYVDSEADTGERKVELPKQSAHIASAMIGYDKHGLDLRLAVKYRDRYIDSLEDEGYDRYTDDHLQWDITAKYRFNENWQVYTEIANLNDAPEYYYAGNKSRLLQYDEYGTTYALGLQYNFQ